MKRLSFPSIKRSIKSRIFFLFIFVMVLPTATLSISSYFISINILKDKISSSYAESTVYIGNSIEWELNQIKKLSDYIFMNKEIKMAISNSYKNGDFDIEEVKKINTLLDEYSVGSSLNKYIYSIILTGAQDKTIFYGNMFILDGKLIGADESSISKAEWYQKAIQYNGKTLWLGIAPINEISIAKSYIVSLARVIKNQDYSAKIGVSYITIKSELFSDLLNGSGLHSANQVIVIDNNNRIVYHSDSIMISKEYPVLKSIDTSKGKYHYLKENGKEYMIAYHKIDKYDWWIVDKIPLNELVKENRSIFKATMLIFILSFVITGFIWYFVTSGIVQPIIMLTGIMKGVRDGNLLVKSEYSGDDEIGVMSANFNYMMERLNFLFRNLLEEQAKKKDAEYKTMLAQTNPHFIYNTLNTIRWMAIMQKNDSIKEVVEVFGRLIKNTTTKIDQFITIEEEFKNLRDYIYIQQIRYKDKFDVVYNIDEHIGDYKCIKFILQPLVENAIFHGIEPKEGRGSIWINASTCESTIVFFIKDNGVGMTQQQIDDVLSGNEERKRRFCGIGIKNVDERIKMEYGEQYGIKIESIVGEFTRIKLIMPILS
jgi:two-component system, sensor histidine kinase YesM